MQSKELIKIGLQTSDNLIQPMLADLKDSPLTAPTSAGGNHAWWIAGHLTFAEGHLLWNFMRGEPNPLAEWKELFAGGTQPLADAAGYPAYDEILGKYQDIRVQTYALLESLSEEDLDQASKNVPAERKDFFGTYRQCFLAIMLHGMMHRGQLADVRRTLGRDVMMA
jgi:hypothetical protein